MRSKPNKEMPLWHEIRARGVECFYPYLRVEPVNPRCRTIQPYFPGYLFVHADLEQIGFSPCNGCLSHWDWSPLAPNPPRF